MLRFVAMLAVSFYFFPIQFTFFPAMNTKMAMAAFGVFLFTLECVKNKTITVERDTFLAVLAASLVSLVGIISVIYNHTNDYSYATYIVSMIVWLAGAYTAVWFVRLVEGVASCVLVCNYIIAVCVFQCLTAILIDMIPAVKSFVDLWLYGFGFTDLADVKSIKRMYGIGATLDVAGTRFASVLIMISVLLRQRSTGIRASKITAYSLSFIAIGVIGNMIGRTTTVGIVMSIVYWVTTSESIKMKLKTDSIKVMSWFLVLLTIMTSGTVYLYNNNRIVHNNLRFAFEGFFSLVETGEWHTNSGDRLENMYVWPDNEKTWIIGDGHFEGIANDVNYVGNSKASSFYMSTDVGYCRFIFYFGVIGLLAFSCFFLLCGKICFTRFSKYKLLFLMIVLLNFVIWMKVSTDLFLVLALFLCVGKTEDEEYEEVHESITVGELE